MNKHIYINDKQIEYFSKHGISSFLFEKEHLSFFEHLQQIVYAKMNKELEFYVVDKECLEFYVVDKECLDLVNYKGFKIYKNVARFENFFKVKFLDTTTTKADKSHYRDILLGKLLIDSDE
jgi:hypothetical protein